jgi:hypothetical protein
MSESNTKILKLDRSRTDRAFKKEESLWENELKRMRVLIDNHVQAIKIAKKKEIETNWKEMPRLSIGIYGSPGSGKSSLVETFVDMVNDKDNSILKSLGGNFHSLPVIKPNALAKGEHFLYKFLAAALNEDKEKKSKKSPHRESSILSELEQKFQEVSQYLQVINEADCNQDDDPLGVSLDRLDRHESELRLVKEMAEFIDTLADSLVSRESSAVIFMPVDDSDFSMDTLISAVGTCLRYLQHPKLVPIFTFTGRLAEEMLSAFFQEKITGKGIKFEKDKQKEASTQLLMAENMAIQYLGKLFPVRNRIRMGPASARVLGAEYTSPDFQRIENANGGNGPEGHPKEIKVLELLKVVSNLLFGHARVPVIPAIRQPLRAVTLRRQVQIVDAMQAIGVERLMRYLDIEKYNRSLGKEDSGKNSDVKKNDNIGEEKVLHEQLSPDKTWGQLFDLAAWTLLNAHRDVLKEFRLNLDDLYGWTPKGIRQVVLDSILKMGKDDRWRLIKHWRFRTEDRRSQILSLLAVNVFRPRMKGEEPTGDKPDLAGNWLEPGDNNKNDEKDIHSFPSSHGLRWFVGLCIGFYIPQILACNRGSTGAGSNSDASGIDTISGIGWDFSSGPIHAVREAIGNRKIFSTGMMFLNPKNYCTIVDPADSNEENVDLIIYTTLWCFYGYKEGKPWASVSLWRGLCLMAQLLRLVDVDLKEERQKIERSEKIRIVLRKHLGAAEVIGDLPEDSTGQEKKEVVFPRRKVFDWNYDIYSEGDKTEQGEQSESEEAKKERLIGEAIENWVEKLDKWLDTVVAAERIYPMLSSSELNETDEGGKWKKCFTRRLHGENLLSTFFEDIEGVYYYRDKNEQKEIGSWNLYHILSNWFSVLTDYWNTGNKKKGKENNGKQQLEGIGKLMMSCPVFKGLEESKIELYKENLKKIKIETLVNSIFEDM